MNTQTLCAPQKGQLDLQMCKPLQAAGSPLSPSLLSHLETLLSCEAYLTVLVGKAGSGFFHGGLVALLQQLLVDLAGNR